MEEGSDADGFAVEHLPAYVVEGLERQDEEALEEAISLARHLLAARRQEAADAADDLGSGRFEVVVGRAREDDDSTTKVVKWVTCGDAECECATAQTREDRHGPYLYHVVWTGRAQEWRYKGAYMGEIPD